MGPYICIYGLGGMYAWGRGHRGMCVYGGYMCMGYGCWGGNVYVWVGGYGGCICIGYGCICGWVPGWV